MSRMMPLYKAIANALSAYVRCAAPDANDMMAEWEPRWLATLDSLSRGCLPSGSGFDAVPEIDSTFYRNRIVITGSFHKMDEHGGYDGWRDFLVTVRPDLIFGFDIKVSGRQDDLADYIAETYAEALRAEVDFDSHIPAPESSGAETESA